MPWIKNWPVIGETIFRRAPKMHGINSAEVLEILGDSIQVKSFKVLWGNGLIEERHSGDFRWNQERAWIE